MLEGAITVIFGIIFYVSFSFISVICGLAQHRSVVYLANWHHFKITSKVGVSVLPP